jgi:hypothetical protein
VGWSDDDGGWEDGRWKMRVRARPHTNTFFPILLSQLWILASRKNNMADNFNFRCNTSSGADLCFFGGVCLELDNSSVNHQERCICPDGFRHDFVLFHTPNCALPNLALEIFAGVFSLIWLVVFIWYMNKVRQLRGKTKVVQLARIGMVNMLSSECLVIGLVTQSGLYEASIVMLCLGALCLNIFIHMITLQMFQFAHAMYFDRVKQMERVLNYGLAVYIGAMLISCGYCLALARTLELRKFDAALCAMLSVNYFALVILCSVAAKYIHEFLDLLTTSVKNKDLSSGINYNYVLNRLRSMQWVFKIIVLIQLSFAVLIILVRIVLGSFPFVWVFFFVGVTVTLGAPFGTASLFPEFDKSSTDDKKPTKRVNITTNQIEASNSEEAPTRVSSFM